MFQAFSRIGPTHYLDLTGEMLQTISQMRNVLLKIQTISSSNNILQKMNVEDKINRISIKDGDVYPYPAQSISHQVCPHHWQCNSFRFQLNLNNTAKKYKFEIFLQPNDDNIHCNITQKFFFDTYKKKKVFLWSIIVWIWNVEPALIG